MLIGRSTPRQARSGDQAGSVAYTSLIDGFGSDGVQVLKEDCTPGLVEEWEESKRMRASPRTLHQGTGRDTPSPPPLKKRRILESPERRVVEFKPLEVTSPQSPVSDRPPKTSGARQRQRRIVIDSWSQSTEIQETQQQQPVILGDSISVEIPAAFYLNGNEYESLPSSSIVEPLPRDPVKRKTSEGIYRSSTQDDETDSGLGLSTPTDEVPLTPNLSSGGDQQTPFFDIDDPSSPSQDAQLVSAEVGSLSATQSTDPRLVKADQRMVYGAQSDPIEDTPGSTLAKEDLLPEDDQSSAVSSALLLFSETLRSSEKEADKLTGAASPQPSSPDRHTPEHPLQAVVSNRSLHHQITAPPAELPEGSAENHNKSTPLASPTQRLPKARLFQTLELASDRSESHQNTEPMATNPREASPRLRRSAPPTERFLESLSLRETLAKQTAPARAMQEARHARNAARALLKATSATATPSTGSASIEATPPVTFKEHSLPKQAKRELEGGLNDVHEEVKMEFTLPQKSLDPAASSLHGAMQVNHAEPALSSNIQPAASIYTNALGSSALPLQQSVEDEDMPVRLRQSSLPTSPNLIASEYIVPLPVDGKIKEHYLECVRVRRRSLLKFIRPTGSTGRLDHSRGSAAEKEKMTQLIDRLNDTTTHLDLGLDGPATQHPGDPEKEAQWSYYASPKCAFLWHLIEALRNEECSLIIMAREGPKMDLLEAYMRAIHVNYRRPPQFDAAEVYAAEGSHGMLRVDLLATNTPHYRQMTRRPILIIAFDTSFDPQDPQVQSIRQPFELKGQPVPILHPLIQNSAEHVDLCISRSMPSPKRFQLLVETTYRARIYLGGDPIIIQSQEDEELSTMSSAVAAVRKSFDRRFSTSASRIAKAALSNDVDSRWPVFEVDLELDTTADTSPSSVARPRSATPRSRAGTPATQKRLRDGESDSSISLKRQRLTPAPEMTHVSDSVRNSQSQLELARHELEMTRGRFADAEKAKSTTEEELAKKQKQLDEHVLSLEALQHRYETRMKQSHEEKNSLQKLQVERDVVQKRLEKSLADNLVLKDQQARQKAELATSRQELAAGGGTMADVEIARAEARSLLEENTSLEKSIANMRRDFEFTRQQYQEASTVAAENGSRVMELESENVQLQQQARDEKRKLKELNFESDVQRYLSRIDQLELMLHNRDIMLQRKEDELKAIRKGRGVSTRGTSVQPGSPRPSGSRGASPAPGLLAPGVHAPNRASALRNER